MSTITPINTSSSTPPPITTTFLSSSALPSESSEVACIPLCFYKFIKSYFKQENADKISSSKLTSAIPPESSDSPLSTTPDWQMLLPITSLLKMFVTKSFSAIKKECIYKSLTAKENASFEDALQSFVVDLHTYKKTNNPKPLINYCTKFSQLLHDINRIKQSTNISSLINEFDNIIEMLAFPSFMEKNSLELSGKKEQVDNVIGFRFHVAVNSYAHLANTLTELGGLIELSFENSENNKTEQNNHSDQYKLTEYQYKVAEHKLLLTNKFSQEDSVFFNKHKIDILRIYRGLKNEVFKNFHWCINSLNNIIIDPYPQKKTNIVANGSNCCCTQYIDKNRETYESFLPHTKEHIDYLLERSGYLVRICEILDNFHSYLHYGDCSQLKKQFEEGNDSFGNFHKTLTDEIIKFSEQKKSNSSLLTPTKNSLNSKETESLETQMLPLLENQLRIPRSVKSIFSKLQINIEALLDKPLQLAEEYSKDLWPVLPPQIIPKKTKEKKSTPNAIILETAVVAEKSQDLASEKNYSKISDPSLSPVITTAALIPTEKKIESLPILLDSLKTNSDKYFEQLLKGCKGFDTNFALNNAKEHFISFLRTVNRISNKAKSPMKRTEIFSLITDFVNHGNLAVEQMLSALDRESNNLSTDEELKSHLSHNLVEILFSCKFIDGGLLPNVRQWIAQINGGELSSREVALHSYTKKNFVQNLLIKAWLFSKGIDAFDLSNIASDVASYTNNLGAFCANLSEQLQLTKKHPVDTENAQAIQSTLTAINRKIATEIASIKIQDSSSPPTTQPKVLTTVEKIRTQLDNQLKNAESNWIQASLGNILNNLLVRLECELQMHEKLQPAEASLHYNNVLLLEQLIAEQFLQNLIDAQAICTEEEISSHDLKAMIKALGFKEGLFTSEEIDFLSRGKKILELVRYPASYFNHKSSSHHSNTQQFEKIAKEAQNLSNQLSITEHHESGYSGNPQTVVAHVKTSVQKNLGLLLSIMEKVLTGL